MLVRGLSLAGVLAGLAVLAAGCGGSKSPSVASITTTSAGQTTQPATGTAGSKPDTAALVTCLRSHGLTAEIGSGGGSSSTPVVQLAGVIVTGTDPSSPRFQAALAACHKYMPGGGPPQMSPTQKAEWVTAMTSFAGCMRKNGLPNFPDPTGAGTFPPGFLGNFDPSSTQFQNALKTCQKLEPGFGPRIG
jgi:hypothetical protein